MEDHRDASAGEKTNETGNKVVSIESEAPKKKRSRGPSRLEKLEGKGPFALEWDKAGCPTGKYATSFASYCGKRVRCHVNINFNDWDKDVEVGLKNLLWEDISKKYLINERHKDYVLFSCGSKWKDFKTKLTNKWIRNKHPKYESPADYYTYLEHADWDKFRSFRETQEFKEKSKKAKESIKHLEHPHLMGRRGYNQRIPEWGGASYLSTSSLSSSSSLVTDRSWRWIKARSKSDGTIPNEKTQKVAEEMAEWQKKVDSGEFVPNRYDDVLSRSTHKKEHPGRVVGCSGGLTIKDIFGSSCRTSHQSVGISDKEIEEITKRVQKETVASLSHLVRQETFDILKKIGLEVPKDLVEPHSSCQSKDVHTSDGISKERHSTLDLTDLKESTNYRLACVHDGKAIIVAEGIVYPPMEGTPVIHSVPLLSGNVRVSIVKVIEGKAPLPVPTQYIERVGDAMASFIQWPKQLVMIGGETSSASPPIHNKEAVSKGSGTKSPSEPLLGERLSNIGLECERLRKYLASQPSNTKIYEVVVPSRLFSYKQDKLLFLAEEEIIPLFEMKSLNASCIQMFMMFIHQLWEKNNEGAPSVGLLCPSILSQMGDNEKVIQHVILYVECSLLKMGNVDIVLAPFRQHDHWMLAILFPRIHEAYFCDPMNTTRRDVSFKYMLKITFKGFKAQAGPTLKSGMTLNWRNITCHQQRGSTECGYYVMRYMLDIVRHYRMIKDPKKWFGSTLSYTHEEMNEVRELWAAQFMQNQLDV